MIGLGVGAQGVDGDLLADQVAAAADRARVLDQGGCIVHVVVGAVEDDHGGHRDAGGDDLGDRPLEGVGVVDLVGGDGPQGLGPALDVADAVELEWSK